MKFVGTIFGILGAIVVIAILGSMILEQFPTLQPLWDEGKLWISTVYRHVQAEYGTAVVIVFVVGIVAMFATSARNA